MAVFAKMLNSHPKEIALVAVRENTARSMDIKAKKSIQIALGQDPSVFQKERKGLHEFWPMPVELVEGVVSSSGSATRVSSFICSRRACAR